jgi:ADP-ribosylglycohydrolase
MKRGIFMLQEQKWMKYDVALMLEWQQAKDEGRDVEYLRELCELVASAAKTEPFNDIAQAIRNKLINAPVLPGYPFVEPSELEKILVERRKTRHKLNSNISIKELKNKLAGAWIGRISGCLLGKPVEGFKKKQLDALLKATDNYPMSRYITKGQFPDKLANTIEYDSTSFEKRCWADTINGIAPVDDDTNYTVLAMKIIEHYGKDFCSNDVLEAWLSWVPMFSTCTAERVAYRNAATGMYAPETAIYNNPYRERIGAQIRGDFFGYINPGDSEKAAKMAWRDACISHVKNGIYGEMFVAAMNSAAAVCEDMITVINAGLDQIPEKSRLYHDINKVLSWYKTGETVENVINYIHQQYNEYNAHEWCHTNSNAMIVVMALLYGKKDFGKSICLSVQAAFDTDCNGATVGSIIGMTLGENAIPPYWYECMKTFN